jgi:hypothetical protein
MPEGMELRDWFAGLAMQAFVASKASAYPDTISEDAYKQADSMMKQRDKLPR